MRVLLDDCKIEDLRELLFDHEIFNLRDCDWIASEGETVIELAEQAGFDVLVSCNKNLRGQQNQTGRKISVIVLLIENDGAPIGNILAPKIFSTIESIPSGSFVILSSSTIYTFD